MIVDSLKTTLEDPADFSPTNRIICPICDFEYVKLGAPKITFSDDYTAWQGRGPAIRIPAECENGCAFSVCFGFHKGNTFGFIEYKYR